MDLTFGNAIRALDPSRHAAPQVFDHLRDEIVSLALPPGTTLNRTELQARFRLSSTPIRDALLRLRDEGFVDIFPQSATVVSAIDLTAARQAQFLRLAVELEVVRVLATDPDEGLISRLQGMISRQKALAELNELDLFNALDQSFHQAMYEAAGVSQLWTIVRRNSGQIDRLRRLHLPEPGKAQQIVADHLAVVEAVAAGKAADAEEAVRGHLSRSLAFSAEMRVRYPDYFRD